MTSGITQAEYARRIGKSKAHVTALKQAGRLVLTPDGLVDPEASDQRVKETEDPNRDDVRARWAKRRARAVQPEVAPAEGAGRAADRSAAEESFAEARARKMRSDANMAEMDERARAGELCETADVRAAGTEAGTTLRATLENLPDQLAAELAPITDPDRVHALLVEHVEAVLVQISDAVQRAIERAVACAQEGI